MIPVLKKLTEEWSNGIILDEAYSKSLQDLAGHNPESFSFGTYYDKSATLILSEPSKEDKLNTEGNPSKYSADKIIEVFPFIEVWNPSPIFSGKFSDSFKAWALLWISGKISDEEFVNSIDAFKTYDNGITNPSLTEELFGEIELLSIEREDEGFLDLINLAQTPTIPENDSAIEDIFEKLQAFVDSFSEITNIDTPSLN